MKLGYAPSTALVLDLDEAFRLAGDLKLDFVELSWDLQEMEPSLQPVARVRELCRATGIATTVHLPFVDVNLASLMPGVRENSVARVQRGIEYSAEVGATCGVLHSGLVAARHPQLLAPARRAAAASLAALRPDVPVAIENLALDYNDLLRGPQELAALTTEAGAGFGNTLDFGHANVEGCTTNAREGGPGGETAGQEMILAYQRSLGSIIHLHLHDNDGSADQHRAVGSGRIRWQEHRQFLTDFQGTACLEIAGGPAAVRESVAFLRELLA